MNIGNIKRRNKKFVQYNPFTPSSTRTQTLVGHLRPDSESKTTKKTRSVGEQEKGWGELLLTGQGSPC